jgi:hypothetical protein
MTNVQLINVHLMSNVRMHKTQTRIAALRLDIAHLSLEHSMDI